MKITKMKIFQAWWYEEQFLGGFCCKYLTFFNTVNITIHMYIHM